MSLSSLKYRRKPHLLRPPVPQLFHSNRIISDTERHLILKAIACVEQEIRHLKEIEHSEGDSEVLYRHRLTYEEFVFQHKRLLHWTRRLPPELLIHIFISCTGGNVHIPWNVSQVCRKWRSIALATPQLWRIIPIQRRFRDESSEKQFLRFLGDYLNRSAGKSIVFSLLDRQRGDIIHRIYETLLQHAERWGDVELYFHGHDDPSAKQALVSLEGRLCSLYSLKLKLDGCWRFNYPLNIFKSAPRLKYLQFDASSCVFLDELPTMDWPWNQVTHFTGSYYYMDLFDHTLLAQSSNLVHLELNGCFKYENLLAAEGPQVAFGSCKYLRLELEAVPYLLGLFTTRLFRVIRFPILEHLRITYSFQDIDEDALAAVVEFIKQHASNLQGLHWDYKSFDPRLGSQDHTPALVIEGSLQNLEVLRFTEPTCSTLDEFLMALMNDRTLLPSLRNLEIRGIHSRNGIKGIRELCQMLDALVRGDENADDIKSMGLRRIQEVRIDVARTNGSPQNSFDLKPWDIVSLFERWDEELRQGWDRQVKLEFELKKVEGWNQILRHRLDGLSVLSAEELEALLVAVTGHEVTDILVLHVTRIHQTLLDVLDQNLQLPLVPTDTLKRISELLIRWAPMFLAEAPSRRWTAAGNTAVSYISPHSPFRTDPFTWMFGVAGDEPHTIRLPGD